MVMQGRIWDSLLHDGMSVGAVRMLYSSIALSCLTRLCCVECMGPRSSVPNKGILTTLSVCGKGLLTENLILRYSKE
jgi:hypothetical protein